MTAAGHPGGTPVTAANALAHFQAQFLQDLAGQYYGFIDATRSPSASATTAATS